jgi:CMP-N,N'-diacetyllegionaminic acid synthase
MIALVPARGGSKRLPGKNVRLFCGHPLIAYTLGAAQDAGIFTRIVVSTEDAAIAALVRTYGIDVIDRPATLALDTSPDVQWVRHALDVIGLAPMQTWAILRPTSPFRTADTIRRAYAQFRLPDQTADSLRAVEPVTQHPGKMWTQPEPGGPLKPLLDQRHPDGTPWHSSPTQTLPRFYVQNACLEMGWTANLTTYGTIHGRKVDPFFTVGHEGYDLNTAADWRAAEGDARTGEAVLPRPVVADRAEDAWAV